MESMELWDVYINDTLLCGPGGWTVWDSTAQQLSRCFTALVLVLPAQVLVTAVHAHYSPCPQVVLAVMSAYYLGHQTPGQYYLRTRAQVL